MLGSFFRNAKFLLEEISKPLRCNSPQFFRARAGSYHRFPMPHCLRARVRAAQDPRFPYEAAAAPNQSLGRLEPAARSAPRAARKRWKSRPKEELSAGLHQAVVVNNRIMVPPNVALTISRAAPTAMKPTNARTHDPTKTSERIPNTIAAIPIRISIPLAAAEPW